jgi:hypothetical protein
MFSRFASTRDEEGYGEVTGQAATLICVRARGRWQGIRADIGEAR